jgi:alkylation response protein AidB-like acyl-CoA dehydrogenase
MIRDMARDFAQGELAPIAAEIDETGEFPYATVRKMGELGLMGLTAPAEYGGVGADTVSYVLAMEEISKVCASHGVIMSVNNSLVNYGIQRFGTEAQKQRFLVPLASGAAIGAYSLTEPQSGSDLSTITSKAVPHGDRYLISGRKIYITWGDHPMTENIVHLVLARLPDAPPGNKGISLFLVPKYKLNADGTPGERNDVFAVSVEHKLGIHGSPTCVMAFGDEGGAEGFLVGKPNEGLAAMFVMMNYMRLGVGAQGVGLSERAYQKAVAYARERKQGRAPGEKGVVPIIRHPDIRRSLLLMRALTQASRSIVYYTASCLDRGSHGVEAEAAAFWQARGELMTPIAKAWTTEIGQEVTSLGMQVHGGMGYVEETGAAQFYRDVRIASIYEGTNAIQAIDLVGRKVLRDGGACLSAFVSDMRAVDAPLANAGDDLALVRAGLAKGLDELVLSTTHLLTGERKDPELASAAAYNYLMLIGTVIGGWQLARAALVAHGELGHQGADRAFLETQVVMARFYAEQVMPRALAHGAAVRAGSGTIMALGADHY